MKIVIIFLILTTKTSLLLRLWCLDKCYICHEKAEDTHHIQYQSKSDSNGYFENFHKDDKANLMPLCKACHKKEHNGEISISGFVQTSEGIVVKCEDSKEICYEQNDHGLSEDDIIKIKQYIKRGKCSWFVRNNKTNSFKRSTNELKILEKIN